MWNVVIRMWYLTPTMLYVFGFYWNPFNVKNFKLKLAHFLSLSRPGGEMVLRLFLNSREFKQHNTTFVSLEWKTQDMCKVGIVLHDLNFQHVVQLFFKKWKWSWLQSESLRMKIWTVVRSCIQYNIVELLKLFG